MKTESTWLWWYFLTKISGWKPLANSKMETGLTFCGIHKVHWEAQYWFHCSLWSTGPPKMPLNNRDCTLIHSTSWSSSAKPQFRCPVCAPSLKFTSSLKTISVNHRNILVIKSWSSVICNHRNLLIIKSWSSSSPESYNFARLVIV